LPATTLADFAPTIRALTSAELDGAPSLFDRLRIAADGDVEVCYAPFEHVNPSARVVLVATPRWRLTSASSVSSMAR
jgi:hypothetical protein